MPKTTEELYQELLAQGNQYQQQANDLLSQYDNRGAFSYDPNNDASYQALKNLYVNQGRRAMQDTMGQAAGLTGGYGSSYSQSVGNQAYNEYLTKLNAEIPGLAQQARAAYDAEGQRMLDRYNLALNAANTAYGQGRDALGDLRYEQEWAQKQQEYADDLAYRDWQKQQAEASAASDQAYREWQMQRSDQSDARDIAMMMIQMGQTPNAELLAKAGLSASDAQIMARYYAQQAALSAGGDGSGGGKYKYKYEGTPKDTPDDGQTENTGLTSAEQDQVFKYFLTNGIGEGMLWLQSTYGSRLSKEQLQALYKAASDYYKKWATTNTSSQQAGYVGGTNTAYNNLKARDWAL